MDWLDVRGMRDILNGGSDLRAALRSFRRSPILFLAMVVCLALGLGSNVAVFSWANGFVLHPIAGASRQSELVVVDGLGRSGSDQRLSFPVYRDLRERSKAFENVMVQTWQPMVLADEAHAERLWGELVSANFFETLGVEPALGRFFLGEEDRGPGLHPVAVISHSLWKRRFEGRRDVLGETLRLNGHVFTIVGVAPESFRGGIASLAFDLWVPIMMADQVVPGTSRLERRDLHWLGCWARLRSGGSLEAARAEVASIADSLAREYPESHRGEKLLVFPLWDAPWGATNFMRPIVIVLSGVSVMVLLIACVNVAQLLLARGLDRRSELAVRSSLGAGRGRLARLLLVEAALLSTGAGALGLLLGNVTAQLLQALVPPTRFPLRLAFEIEPNAIFFAVVLVCGTMVLFGLLPAIEASRTNACEALVGDSRGAAPGGRKRFQRAFLVVAQVALSMTLLAMAAVFLGGFQRARSQDPGFATKDLLLASIDLSASGYDEARGLVLQRRLLEEVRSQPFVEEATFARRLPLDFGGFPQLDVDVEGYVPDENEDVRFGYNDVGPRYLETMKIPLVRGREIDENDRAESPGVVLVNETAASRYWKGLDPVGRAIRVGAKKLVVVGVVVDSKYRDLYEAPTPYLYRPLAQSYDPQSVLHVRSKAGVSDVPERLRDIVRRLDPSLALYDVRTMADHLGVATFQYRLASTLLLVFAGLSLVLSSLGLYGLMSFGVASRRSEMGLRAAVGARRADLLWLVVAEAMKLSLWGMGAGLVGAVVVERVAAHVLPSAVQSGPYAFVAAGLVLLVDAFAASFVPARRAGRVDPATALRGA